MQNANYSRQLPNTQPAITERMNMIVLPANLKLISTPRMTLPSFSGSTDGALVEDWLQESEKVATFYGWDDVSKIQNFTKKLKGDALTYCQTNLTSINDYNIWRGIMFEKFVQNHKNFFLRQLDQLRQKSDQSVKAFAQEIDSCLVKTLGLGVFTDKSLKTFCFHVKLAYFTHGLREDIQKEICPFSLLKNPYWLSSWSYVVNKIQDTEWLVKLRKNKLRRNGLQLRDHVKVYVAISVCEKFKATGFGVFFGENDPKNVSRSERHTCNVSLIIAAITAIKQAKKHGIARLVIYNNSDYLLKFNQEWAIPWLENAWRRPNGHPVLNINHWRNLLTAQEEIDVKWVGTHKTENGFKRARDLALNGLRQ